MSIGDPMFDTEELLHLSLYAIQNNQTDQAINHLKLLIQNQPNHGKAQYLLGALHAEIGLYDRAVTEMQKAIELEPNLHTARFQLGLLHITAGRVQQAEQVWKPLESLGKNEPLLLFKTGMLQLVADQFTDCISNLQKGITLNTLNEDLNNDMRNIIKEAQKSLDNAESPANGSGNNDTSDSKKGKLALLSAYKKQIETQNDN